MTLGEKLRQSRLEKKMTQKQLADLIDAKHNSVSDWENDKNKPDPDTIELLCGVLEISPNYLLSINEDGFSPAEKLLIKKYRELDSHGTKMVDFALQEEWERSTSDKNDNIVVMEPSTYEVNAAHALQGATPEEKKHDDDIMDDDNF